MIAAVLLVERDLLTYWYWTDAQPYGTSLALLAAPMLAARNFSWRVDLRSAGVAAVVLFLLVVTLWVNLSLVLFILPLFLGLAIVERSKGFLVLAMLVFLAYELDAVHASHVRVGEFAYEALRPSWASIVNAAGNLADLIHPLPAASLVASGTLAGWWLGLDRPIVRTALIMLAVAVFGFLITANLQWVQQSLSAPRYFLVPINAVIVTSAALTVEAAVDAFAGNRSGARLITFASLASLVLATIFIVLPLNTRCRFIDSTAGVDEVAQLVAATDASFVDGDYWMIWPAVFLSNRPDREPVFGLAFRAEGARKPIRRFLASHPHPVILCVGKLLADCVGRFGDMLGRQGLGAVREIASGELMRPRLPWVAASLDYASPDRVTGH